MESRLEALSQAPLPAVSCLSATRARAQDEAA